MSRMLPNIFSPIPRIRPLSPPRSPRRWLDRQLLGVQGAPLLRHPAPPTGCLGRLYPHDIAKQSMPSPHSRRADSTPLTHLSLHPGHPQAQGSSTPVIQCCARDCPARTMHACLRCPRIPNRWASRTPCRGDSHCFRLLDDLSPTRSMVRTTRSARCTA